jgi:cystathionine beta-lyase
MSAVTRGFPYGRRIKIKEDIVMKYDFTSIMDRRGKDAIAVDGLGTLPGFAPDLPKDGFDTIPMWVADMNFPTVPTICESIVERVQHPAFGYFNPSEEYYNAIIKWQVERNGATGLTKECIGYENGVLGGVISVLNAFSAPGDAVLLHSPTYIGFTMSLENNGRKIIHSPLKQDEDGVWRMDYEDMDKKIKAHKIHTAVFCNPHNPCGRVWEKWEIEKAMEVYKNNDCIVISDEIWSDLILDGNKHIPVQSVSEDARMRTVAIYAPSKTFNLAGLIGSYHIIYDPYLRDRVRAQSSKSHYNDMNVLSMHALIGAYRTEGAEWVDELCQVLTKNVNYAYDYITKNFKGVKLSKPQGTYMLFMDCTDWCNENGKTIDELEKRGWDVGVAWQDGRMFHGPCSIRLNVALPFSRVEEAMKRLDEFVFNAK